MSYILSEKAQAQAAVRIDGLCIRPHPSTRECLHVHLQQYAVKTDYCLGDIIGRQPALETMKAELTVDFSSDCRIQYNITSHIQLRHRVACPLSPHHELGSTEYWFFSAPLRDPSDNQGNFLRNSAMVQWLFLFLICVFLCHHTVSPFSAEPMVAPGDPGNGNLLLISPKGTDRVPANETRLRDSLPQPERIISCGARYRTDLKDASCQDAVNQMPNDVHLYRFGFNRPGIPRMDVVIPLRYISCM